MTYVVCIGAATQDTIFRVPRHPEPDDLVVASDLVVAGGGPAATAAVTLARLGVEFFKFRWLSAKEKRAMVRVENLDALPAFVFQTARNICLHHGRSAHRETGALRRFGSSQPLVTGEEADPLFALIDRSRREQVRAALEAMRPEDRDLLRMLYVDALDTAEVAQRLGIDSGALRVRKHRALQRLSGILGNVSGRSGTEGGV